MRVSLIRPPVITAPRSLSYYGAVPDLGLAYVAAAARAAGHDVSVIDAPGEALDVVRPWPTAVGELARTGLDIPEIVARIPADTDVVGFAHMFLHEWGLLRQLITAVKRARPNALTIAGGENATGYYAPMLRECPELDACLCGEGELAFTQLLEHGDLQRAASVVYREDGRPRAHPRAPRITDLDALARPAWDLFPVERYLQRGLGSGVDRGRSLPVLTSRGCPYQCTFCSSPQMWTTRYHRRDPERVLDEIEELQRRYRVRNININDLTALLTKEWILDFCHAIERRGLEFTWQLPSGTRSEAVDREAAEAMARTGCRNFCYAPESGSPDELRRIKKRVKLPKLRASLRASLRAGLTTHASLILGMPGQRPSDLARTWALSLGLARDGLHGLSVLVFAPYPGSEEYRRLEAAGRIAHDDAFVYSSLLRSVGAGRSRRLAAAQVAMLGTFYAAQYLRRPGRAADVALNAIRGTEQTVMDQFLRTKLRGVSSPRSL